MAGGLGAVHVALLYSLVRKKNIHSLGETFRELLELLEPERGFNSWRLIKANWGCPSPFTLWLSSEIS